jgi:ribonuclease HI
MEDKKHMINVWTDGACKNNPGEGGAGVVIVFPSGTKRRIAQPLGHTKSNRAELSAVLRALKALAKRREEPIVIHTDSQNIIGWFTLGWKFNKNVELIMEIKQCLSKFTDVSFKKVRGHSDDLYNAEADELANQAAMGPLDGRVRRHHCELARVNSTSSRPHLTVVTVRR